MIGSTSISPLCSRQLRHPSFWALRRQKMLSSSLRRAAWAPIGPIAGISRASSQSITTSANGLIGSSQHVRQRRYSSSSSKPSDGSNKVDSSSQTPAKGVNSAEKREGKASRRRGKDSNSRNGSKQQTAFSRLPSVPSTQHLQPHGKLIRPPNMTARATFSYSARSLNQVCANFH